MKSQLSILVPVYNYACLSLITALHQQAEAIDGLLYEIIVVEDGSNQLETLHVNSQIEALTHCRYIIRKNNIGRASIRNFLAREARYDWLLFVDSDMKVLSSTFLINYLLTSLTNMVVYGGNSIGSDTTTAERQLKYRYEKRAERTHRPTQRALQSNRSFNTSNFLINRTLMLRVPFNSNIQTYGYEDVLFGKSLLEEGVGVSHIANPLGFDHYESNESFLAKTEESLHTLYAFRHELQAYSPIIKVVDRLTKMRLTFPVGLFYDLFRPVVRRNLLGSCPSLTLFNIYKLGEYLRIIGQSEANSNDKMHLC